MEHEAKGVIPVRFVLLFMRLNLMEKYTNINTLSLLIC